VEDIQAAALEPSDVAAQRQIAQNGCEVPSEKRVPEDEGGSGAGRRAKRRRGGERAQGHREVATFTKKNER